MTDTSAVATDGPWSKYQKATPEGPWTKYATGGESVTPQGTSTQPSKPTTPESSYPPDRMRKWAAGEPGERFGAILPEMWKEDASGKQLPDSSKPAYPQFIRSGVTGLADLMEMYDNPTKQITPDAVGTLAMVSPVGQGTRLAEKALAGSGTKILDATDRFLAKGKKLEEPKVINDDTKAADKVFDRMQQAHKGGGPTPQEALAQMKKAKEAGKPMSLADVGGEGVRALGGYVARQPGEGREIARGFLNKRDEEAAKRLTGDVDKYLAKGSARQTAEMLAEARSRQGAPLFEEAFRGGSIAPLEKQFEDEFNTAAKTVSDTSSETSKLLNKITTSKAKLATNTDVYIHADTMKELKAAEQKLAEYEKNLSAAHADKVSALERLRQAQEDGTANAPGAVWNPRIQRLIDNPTVRRGLSKGVRIEKNLADAEGRKFDPTEYAIIGEKDGEPIVGKVPNMRLLASAKEGLDSILADASMKDPLTHRLNKEGRSVAKLRRALVDELDRINPAYKEARDVWAGHSASIEAVEFGKGVFTGKPEEIAEEINDMSPAEREFARLGAADAIREKILKTGLGGDEAKAIIKSPWAKMQLRPLFASEKEFHSFVEAVTNERTMFETRQKIMGNSLTQERAAEDTANNLMLAGKAAKGGMAFLGGSYWNSLMTLLSVKRDLGLRNNVKLNEAIAKLVFDPEANLTHLQKAAAQ